MPENTEKTPENTPQTALAPAPRIALAESRIDQDVMYQTIAETINALQTTFIDGFIPDNRQLSPILKAHSTKKYIPDTEIEMLHTHALPLSDQQVKDFKESETRRKSLQFRIEELKNTSKTLAEITGARVRVAYRLARYMTHVRGLGAVGQPLIFTMASTNAQINLLELPMPFNPTAGWYRGLTAVRNLLADASEGDHTYSYLINDEVYTAKGLPILPPPLHDGYFPVNGTKAWEYRRRNHTPADYDPRCDGPLNTYLNIIELLVRHLSIGVLNTDDEAAVACLLNPAIARLAWPCRDDIETFEEYVLLPWLNKMLVDYSPIKAIDEVKRQLNLTHAEAFDFIETAKTYSQHAFTFDPERERSTMLNKLHQLAGACDEAAMVTTQLNTYKLTLQVLGLTKHEEDTNIDKREALSSALEADVVERKLLPATEEPT